MFEPIYLIHWFIIPVLVIVLSHYFFGGMRILSFHSVYLISFFILIYIQALNVYFRYIHASKFILSVWIVPLLYIVVAGALSATLKHGPQKIQDAIRTTDLSKRDIFFSRWTPILSLMFILIILFYMFDKGVSNIPLFYILFNPGNALQTMKLRIGSLESNYGIAITMIYSYSRSFLFPLYVSFLAAITFKKLISKTHFLIVFLAAIFFSALSTAKAPIAYLCFCTLISYFLALKGKVSKVKLSGLCLAFLLLPALLYPLLLGARGLDAVFITMQNLWRRLTWVPSYVCAVYFDAYTNYFPHLGFASNRILARITENEYISTPTFIYDNYFSTTIPGGLVNASYFASLYADWGMVGMLLGTIVVAVLSVSLQILFDKFGKDMIGVAFRSATLISMIQLMQTNIYSASLGKGFVSLPILFIALTFLWIILKISVKNISLNFNRI
jgi:oligosaccharide repeat unit polymerase